MKWLLIRVGTLLRQAQSIQYCIHMRGKQEELTNYEANKPLKLNILKLNIQADMHCHLECVVSVSSPLRTFSFTQRAAYTSLQQMGGILVNFDL